MATREERPMTLGEKIAALEHEIAYCWNLHAAAVAEGDKQMQISLLNTITAARNNLDKLYVEKQGNQSAFSRGKRGIQFSSII
jgi:hypothetical protein